MYHMLNSYAESSGIEVNDQRKFLQQMDPRSYPRDTAPNDFFATGFDCSQVEQAIILQQHPAIALLQQKFKQLERSKEMRSKQLQHQHALSPFSSTLSTLSAAQLHKVRDPPSTFPTLTSDGTPDWNYLFSNQQLMQPTASTECISNSYNALTPNTVCQFGHGLPNFVQCRSMVSSGCKGGSPSFCTDPCARRTLSGDSQVSSGYLQSTESESCMQPPELLHQKQFKNAAERMCSSNSSTSQFSFEHPVSDDCIISLEEESTSDFLWLNQSVESEVETTLYLGNGYKTTCSAPIQRKALLLDPCNTVSRDTYFSVDVDTTLHL